MEAAASEKSNSRTLLSINHHADRSNVFIEKDCLDVITRKQYQAGVSLVIEAVGVLVIKQEG